EERAIEPLAAAVAGEHAARPIGSMRRRSESDNQQSRLRIAEITDGLAPVVPVDVRPSLLGRHLPAVIAQPRTPATADDLAIEFVPGSRGASLRHVGWGVEGRG